DSFIEAIKGFPKLRAIHVAGTNVSANALRNLLESISQGYFYNLPEIGYGKMRGTDRPQLDDETETKYGGGDSHVYLSKYGANLEPRK
ncbi:MAG: hypothetical protein KDA59_04435, partial [Planctomycetales bacterium]|nr:hypothetical protein [Planctomycetales bacterium]